MKIKVINIFKESFKNVGEHKLEWLRVAYAPVMLWALGLLFMGSLYMWAGHSLSSLETILNQPQTVPSNPQSPLIGFADLVYYIAYFIAIYNLYINGFRYGALNEGGDRWWNLHLNWRFVRMILYTLLIGVFAVIYGLIATGITVGLHYSVESIPLTVILGVLFLIIGFYMMLRIGLAFFLIALDHNAPLKTSWKLLKGNVLRLLGLVLLIWVAILLITLIGSAVLALFAWLLYLITPFLAVIMIVLLALFGFMMWILNWAVFSKSLALIYKDLTEDRAF